MGERITAARREPTMTDPTSTGPSDSGQTGPPPTNPDATSPEPMADQGPAPTVRMETPAPAETPPPGPTASTMPPPASAAPPPAPPPAWHRPSDGDSGRAVTIVLGLILLAVGAWFFADQTLGLDLPTLRWSQLWPIALILVGGWILLAAVRRGSR
jgi:hypothetical protein